MSAPGQEYFGQGFKPGVPFAKPGDVSHIALNHLSVAQRKQEFIRYLLEGASFRDIATVMDLHPDTIRNYSKDPVVRKQLAELQSGLLENLDMQVLESLKTKQTLIDECSWIALGRMKEILQDKDAHIGVVAKMIDSALDRTPELSRTKKLDVTERKLTFTGEDLLQAVQVAAEIDQRDRERAAPRDVTPDVSNG